MLTYEVGPDLAGQQVRYAELTVTPYSHRRAGASRREAFCEAIEDARPARPRPSFGVDAALVLRHPRRGRAAGGRGDRCGIALDAAPGRPGQLRPRRPGDRRAAAAVQAVLRPGPRGRAAQRAARRGDHRPGDDLGRAARPRRRADRARHQRRAGPGAAGAPGRARRSRWRSARRPTCAPARCRRSTSTRCRRWSRPACRSPSTPTTRRCSAPPSTTSTRSPPGCSASTPPGWPSWPGPRCRRRSPTPAGKARLLAEIDAYAATRELRSPRRAAPARSPAPRGCRGSAPIAQRTTRRRLNRAGSVLRLVQLRLDSVRPCPAMPSLPFALPAGQPGTAVQLWCRAVAGVLQDEQPVRAEPLAPTPATRSPTVVRSVKP